MQKNPEILCCREIFQGGSKSVIPKIMDSKVLKKSKYKKVKIVKSNIKCYVCMISNITKMNSFSIFQSEE